MAGIATNPSAILRPTRFDSHTKNMDPQSPPAPNNEPIHDSWSVVSAPDSSGESLAECSVRLLADGQPAKVPYEIEMRFTMQDGGK